MKTPCVSSFLTTRTLQLSSSCAQKHEGCSLACWFEFGATLLRTSIHVYGFLQISSSFVADFLRTDIRFHVKIEI